MEKAAEVAEVEEVEEVEEVGELAGAAEAVGGIFVRRITMNTKFPHFSIPLTNTKASRNTNAVLLRL